MKTNKNKQVKIRKTNLDLNEMVINMFNKENWGKDYLIYSYGSLTLKCYINSFNFVRSIIDFKIKIQYTLNNRVSEEVIILEHYTKNESLIEFKKRLFQSIIRKCDNIYLEEDELEARKKLDLTNYYYWNLKDNDIIFYGEKKSLELLKKLPEEDYEEYYVVLQQKVARKIKKIQKELIETHKATRVFELYEIDCLISDLLDEIEKLKEGANNEQN